MKKLDKLIINPEKIIKNEELLQLRGGYSGSKNADCRDSSETSLGCVTWEIGDCDEWIALQKCKSKWPSTTHVDLFCDIWMDYCDYVP